jgi:hypothetical protein
MTLHSPIKPCPIVAGATARMQADLLAEAIEIDIAFSAAILKGIREGNDIAVIEAFRCKDAAHRTARSCAEDLRRTIQSMNFTR